MNNKIKHFFLLINDNQVQILETNLKCFHEKVIEQDIGLTFGLSTLRNRFLENTNFAFPSLSGGIYYFQKIENLDNTSHQTIKSKF